MSQSVMRILFYLFAGALLIAAMKLPEYKQAIYFTLFIATAAFFVFRYKR